MQPIEISRSIGVVVAERLSRARVFESFGLDYCCNGHIPLAEACRLKGVDPQKVIEALEASDAEPKSEDSTDWRTSTLTELADHIEATHHEFLNREIPRLTGLMGKVVKAHSERHPDLIKVAQTLDGLAAELAQHMAKEEQILFPIIRQMESEGQPESHCGSVSNPINVMEHEHANAGQALARISSLTQNYQAPDDACSSYQALLAGLAELEFDVHQHIHKESSILFPRAIELEQRLVQG